VQRKDAFPGTNSGEIEREFRRVPVEWSGRIYLIDEKDLKDFTNAVNLGIEPRASLVSMDDSSPWYGSFYLRSGDELKKALGHPDLPEKWLSFLLLKPLTVKVISVQEVKKSQFSTTSTVAINKGSKDGLKVGMRLVSKDEVPSQWDGTEVIAVSKATAKIKAATELKVGDKLSTRYKPKIFYR
jgi:hypothetical protein